MRNLALARYRLLMGIRSADWIVGIATLCAALPAVVASAPWAPMSAAFASGTVRASSANAFVVAFALHWTILAVTAEVLANTTNTWGEPVATPNLLDSVPWSPGQRFRGETVGILGTLGVVHLTALPLLAWTAAASPVGTPAVVAVELCTLLMAVFVSSVAALSAVDPGARGARSRTFRVYGLTALLAIAALALTTRLAEFRDAALTLAGQPSPQAWATLTESVENPPLLLLLLAAIYFGFLAWFHLQAVRPGKRP